MNEHELYTQQYTTKVYYFNYQGCMKLIKSESKDIFQIRTALLNFLLIKEVFNIDNKKECFLSTKSAY